jgi:hypothetical protein
LANPWSFVTNLDSSTIEVLAATAARSQAPALKDAFYKYLAGKASIGATISVSIFTRNQGFLGRPCLLILILMMQPKGFRLFTLSLHIPYYVLRQNNDQFEDHRKKFDGTPLRQSWNLPFLSKSMKTSTSTSTDRPHILYEAQMSFVVTGIDHWVWVGYGFVDTYFDSKETVDGYHTMRGPHQRRSDSLAAGQLNADEPIWTPREYFCKVFEIRINMVLKEWYLIVDKVDKGVEQYVYCGIRVHFSHSFQRGAIIDSGNRFFSAAQRRSVCRCFSPSSFNPVLW